MSSALFLTKILHFISHSQIFCNSNCISKTEVMPELNNLLHLIAFLFFFEACILQSDSKENNPLINNSNEATVRQDNKKILKINDIPCPKGYHRKEIANNSFGSYLRNLPLKQNNNNVYLFDGRLKANQDAQYRVVDMEIGNRDLQQCADAIMRLRGEYLYRQKRFADLQFRFTSGDNCAFTKYAAGYRPKIKGSTVNWIRTAQADTSYRTFRKYMDLVFMYAGTYSLSKELKVKNDFQQLDIGDVFIKGGFPGHAVIVVDIAKNTTTGDKAFLLAQSYMPAQEIHVLKNPKNNDLSPWYSIHFEGSLITPEYTFSKEDLKRF